MSDDPKIVEFPKPEPDPAREQADAGESPPARIVPLHATTEPSPEERARRLTQEVERLARLPPCEWLFYIEGDGYADKYGVDKTALKRMVEATIRANEKAQREAKADDRREKQQTERKQERARTEAKREQDRADKEARRKSEEKQKEFAAISKLPRAERDSRLAELARRLGEDPAALRIAFEFFSGAEGDSITSPSSWEVVPWGEPVEVASLLQDLDHKIRKHAALGEHYVTALVLWIAMNWIHNEIAKHSTFLDIGSVDEGSGKTLILALLNWLTLRPCLGTDYTSANIFRTADRDQPTLIIDEAEEAFEDKQFRRIVNTSWTRGAKVPRQVKTNGEWQTYWFNIFCPKIFGHVLLPPAKPLPRTIARRCVSIKIWPKRVDEHVEAFGYQDDDELAVLRRKLARFANDQAKAIAEINPTFPAGFNNSVKDNWKLQLAVAELAGGDWPERARQAAAFIAGKIVGSQGAQLFAAFHAMCAARLKSGATDIVIPSGEAVAFLKDFDPHWATTYRGSDGHPGEITPNKLAALLRHYEIAPEKGTRDDRSRGYAIRRHGTWSDQWLEMFARYCPGLPDFRTSAGPEVRKSGRKSHQPKDKR